MRKIILIAGSAMVLSASPAAAGGLGQRATNTTNYSGGRNSATPTGNCPCQPTHGVSGRGSTAGMSGIVARGASRASAMTLTNSVAGVRSVALHGKGQSARGVQSVGLAGVVSGNGNAAGSVRGVALGHGSAKGLGLAGTVSASVRSTLRVNGRQGHGTGHGVALAGRISAGSAVSARGGAHGLGRLASVSVLNANAGRSGRVANVAVLNGHGSKGRRAAVNVSVLNGTGGASGKLVNVSALNGTGTHGRSVANIAVLNGSGGTSGQAVNVSALNRKGSHGRAVANVAVLNGSSGSGGYGLALGKGIRFINGIPCGPDGRPLTGAAAKTALAALGLTGSVGGGAKKGGSNGGPAGSGSNGVASNSGDGTSGAGSGNVSQTAASQSKGKDRQDLWWQPYNGYQDNRHGSPYDN